MPSTKRRCAFRSSSSSSAASHKAAGDQAQVVDGVLVVIRAGDHGGDGGLRAGTGGGGYGDKGRNGAAHLQETLQTAGAGDRLRLTPRQQPCAQPEHTLIGAVSNMA